MLSEFDKTHVGEILAGMGDWFSAQLLRLCAKADGQNLEKLRLGFPEHVEAFVRWRDGDYEDAP